MVGLGMECQVIGATGDIWRKKSIVGTGDSNIINGYGVYGGEIGGGFSIESEHDLGVMVSEFLENGGSNFSDTKSSSDSDSGSGTLALLSDKISRLKRTMDLYDRDTHSVVKSHILSIIETDLQLVNSDSCNASCIRFSLVKLLRLSGYDAGVCSSKWEGRSKVPGGEHEYIDVVYYTDDNCSQRLIIDIDFQNHFEIARGVESYNKILKSLPVVYVGSLTKLEKFLQVMVEAAKYSLKQSSMPFPPWRSIAYLQAKWQSPYQRKFNSKKTRGSNNGHKQCIGNLKRLQSSLQSEILTERRLKPLSNANNRIVMFDPRRPSLFRKL